MLGWQSHRAFRLKDTNAKPRASRLKADGPGAFCFYGPRSSNCGPVLAYGKVTTARGHLMHGSGSPDATKLPLACILSNSPKIATQKSPRIRVTADVAAPDEVPHSKLMSMVRPWTWGRSCPAFNKTDSTRWCTKRTHPSIRRLPARLRKACPRYPHFDKCPHIGLQRVGL